MVHGSPSIGDFASGGLFGRNEGNFDDDPFFLSIVFETMPFSFTLPSVFFSNVKVFLTKYNYSVGAEDINQEWDFNGITLKVCFIF